MRGGEESAIRENNETRGEQRRRETERRGEEKRDR